MLEGKDIAAAATEEIKPMSSTLYRDSSTYNVAGVTVQRNLYGFRKQLIGTRAQLACFAPNFITSTCLGGDEMLYDTIRYDTIRYCVLTWSKKLTCSPLIPPHGTYRKNKEKRN